MMAVPLQFRLHERGKTLHALLSVRLIIADDNDSQGRSDPRNCSKFAVIKSYCGPKDRLGRGLWAAGRFYAISIPAVTNCFSRAGGFAAQGWHN